MPGRRPAPLDRTGECMKRPAWLIVCLVALVGAPFLVVPPRSSATPAVTDMGALRRQVTSGQFTADTKAGSFITARYDDYGWVSWQVAALKYRPPDVPLVVIIGGSAVRECLTEDDELAADIAKRSGTQVRVVTAATMMQRLPSTLAIIDNLPPGRGVVVIGVHHPTFVATQADAEAQLAGTPLLLASPALHEVTRAEFGDAPAANILPGLIHHAGAYEHNRGIPAFTGRDQTYQRHRYDARGALPLTTKQSMVPRFSQGIGAPGGPFYTSFDFNVALLQRCVALARAKGYEVLLMQDPLNTAACGTAYAPYEAKYQPEVQRIVRSQKAHYVDLNKSVALVDGDFFDLFHLLSSGREKWTAALGGSLAGIVRTIPSASPSAQPRRSTSAAPAATTGKNKGVTSGNSGDKANGTTPVRETAAGGWPVWQITVGVLVAVALFLAALRRRAVVRRRRRIRARRRTGRRAQLTAAPTEPSHTLTEVRPRFPVSVTDLDTTLPL
jgi:hypothetical protein